MSKKLKNTLLLVVGCFIYQVGAVMLVEPYGFAPGGTYGIAMILHHLFGWRTELSALCMDIPLLVIALLVLGTKFGAKTLVCTFILPAFMWIIHQTYGFGSFIEPGITDITLFENQLLASIFGGIIYGVGLGLVFKTGATTGGTDIPAMIVHKYFHLSLGTCVMVIDGAVTFLTVLAFGDWRLPMYSWIIILVETKVIDMIVDGPSSKTMMIISDKIEPIRDYIINELNRGATLIPGKGMYQGAERDIIYIVITRKEMISLRSKVAEIDPRAFINVVDSSEILGEGFKDIRE